MNYIIRQLIKDDYLEYIELINKNPFKLKKIYI